MTREISMTRGTTPTFIIIIKDDVDLTSAEDVHMNFCQGRYVLIKDNTIFDREQKTVQATLTQEETYNFKCGEACVQLHGIFEDGTAFRSKMHNIKVKPSTDEEVLLNRGSHESDTTGNNS